MAQDKTAGFGTLVIAAGGGVIFCVIVVALVLVQPFALDVTVTVYVPGAVTVKFAAVPTTEDPLDHEYVPPPEAVREMLVSEQVNCVAPVLLVTEAVGAVVFWVMMICSVSIHPFEPVTVAVYVPGVDTFILLFIVMVLVPFDHEELTPPEAAKVITVT